MEREISDLATRRKNSWWECDEQGNIPAILVMDLSLVNLAFDVVLSTKRERSSCWLWSKNTRVHSSLSSMSSVDWELGIHLMPHSNDECNLWENDFHSSVLWHSMDSDLEQWFHFEIEMLFDWISSQLCELRSLRSVTSLSSWSHRSFNVVLRLSNSLVCSKSKTNRWRRIVSTDNHRIQILVIYHSALV